MMVEILSGRHQQDADQITRAPSAASASAADETAATSPSAADRALFGLAAAGPAIGAFTLRRLGRRGGALLDVAIGALFARACIMLATGAPKRLRTLPRILLFAEAMADGIATLAGFWGWVWQPLLRPAFGRRSRKRQMRFWLRGKPRPTRAERIATVTWMIAMSLHVTRMAIYVSPGRGVREAH